MSVLLSGLMNGRQLNFSSYEPSRQDFLLIAGPCAVESQEIFSNTARQAKAWGVSALRGGVFKMRTDPRSFQGLGLGALEIVRQAKSETGLPFVCEVTDPRQIEMLSEIVDVYQVGTRSMYNYELLRELGKTRVPVLLKRGLSAYLSEFLLASEYIRREGNDQVLLCERGVRSFEPAMRNLLDLASVPYLKARSGLPVLVDPSHATGTAALVAPMCWAAAAAGADGLVVEVHPKPAEALSDAEQALDFEGFERMLEKLREVLAVFERSIGPFAPIDRERNSS